MLISKAQKLQMGATFEYRSFSPWQNLAGKFSIQSKAAWCDRNRHMVWADKLTSVVVWRGLRAWFVPPHEEFPRSFNFTFDFGPVHCSLYSNCRPHSSVLVDIHYYTFSAYRIHSNTQWQSKMWLHFWIQILFFVAFLFQTFYAVYAFQARNDQELSLQEYQKVRILQFSDLSGNKEWWLAEAKGQKGYVPSNYLGKMTYA